MVRRPPAGWRTPATSVATPAGGDAQAGRAIALARWQTRVYGSARGVAGICHPLASLGECVYVPMAGTFVASRAVRHDRGRGGGGRGSRMGDTLAFYRVSGGGWSRTVGC